MCYVCRIKSKEIILYRIDTIFRMTIMNGRCKVYVNYLLRIFLAETIVFFFFLFVGNVWSSCVSLNLNFYACFIQIRYIYKYRILRDYLFKFIVLQSQQCGTKSIPIHRYSDIFSRIDDYLILKHFSYANARYTYTVFEIIDSRGTDN